MAKYSLQNNRSRHSRGELIFVLIFGVVSLFFLLLPLFKNPLQNVWRWVSLAHLSMSTHPDKAVTASECIVLATPPMQAFDTVVLGCNPDKKYSDKNFVWYKTGSKKYLVGWVTANRQGNIVARLFSTGNAVNPVEIRFAVGGEKYSAIPIGGGTFRVEVPVDVEIADGTDVRHAVSGQLLGVVSGVRVEKGSYVKRVYIKLPFAFESVTRLDVE